MNALGIPTDVSRYEDIQRMVEQTLEQPEQIGKRIFKRTIEREDLAADSLAPCGDVIAGCDTEVSMQQIDSTCTPNAQAS